MIANFERMKLAAKDEEFLPMDYNHASLSSDSEEAKASGWFLGLMLGDDGLYADVRWTKKAAEYIEAKEYKYISPEFTEAFVDEHGVEFEGPTLLAAALTNRPFLKGMAPAALSEKQKNKNKTTKKKTKNKKQNGEF